LSGQGHVKSVDETYREMTSSPIAPLIVSLAIPTVISNLVTTIYNLADTFFIGQISTSASGAIGVAYAMMTLIQAVGFFFGQGAGNAVSRSLGGKDTERAGIIAAVATASAFAGGIVIAIIGHIFLEPLCILCGATDTILPYAETYLGIILIGAPWMATSLVLNNLLRFEGNAFFSMVGLVSGAVLNFVLAPVLIFVCDLGIAGAGLATITCQLLSFVLLLIGMQKAGTVRLSMANLKPTAKLFKTIANGGLPSLLRQVVYGFATICLNTAARPYGDAAIAGIAVVTRVVSIGNCVQIGLGQGFQPVCGYNFGARRYGRVREGFFFAVKASFVVLALMCVAAFAFAPQIVAFLRDDPEVVAVGTATLRFQCMSLPFTGLAMITNFMLQTTGKMWRASFLGVARLGIILAPTVMILSNALGLFGIEMSQSVSDAITLVISIPMATSLLRELARRQAKADEKAASQESAASRSGA
jgi:putative MATE family efflux protein